MSLSRILGLAPSYDQLYLPDPEQHLAWGWNNEGQLGLASNIQDTTDFKLVPKNFVTKDVSIGLSHTLVLSRNGEIYAVGKGKYGRLGFNDENSSRALYSISVPIRVSKISAGSFHSAFITEKHQLYTFGRGDSGQLGHSDFIDQKAPKLLTTNGPVDLVSCGSDHTIFTTLNGSTYGMGNNKFNQVDDSSLDLINTPVLIKLNSPIDNTMARASNISSISCGSSFTVVVKSGSLYAWGLNDKGQCGVSPKESQQIKQPQLINLSAAAKKKELTFISVSTGITHSMALTENGKLYGWGSAQHGQLGLGVLSGVVDIDTSIPMRIGESLHAEFITKVSCGAYHTLVLTAEGLIYAWGTNDFGQVSPETRDMINVPQRLRFQSSKGSSPIMNVFAGGRSSMAIRFYPVLIKVRPSTFNEDIVGIFTNNTNTDCEVILKDKSGNEEKTNIILSHKIFLTKSSIFSEQLDSNTIDVSDEFDNIKQLNNYITNLYQSDKNDLISNHLFLYINNPLHSDVKICVRDQTFYAHKCILVARSNKLKVQLESFFQEGINNTIFIDNVNPEVYNCFLHYLYTDRLNINEENAIELLYLAHEENLERMLELVQDYLINGIDDDNVSPIYDISTRLELTQLGDQCLYYIAKNIETVSKTESFNELPEDLKKKLVSNSVPFKKDKEKNCILM